MFNFSFSQVASQITDAFFSNNANTILAACLIVLAGVTIYIYTSLNKKLDEKDKIISELNEKRLQDMKDSRDIVVEPVREFNGITSAMLNTLGRFHEPKG